MTVTDPIVKLKNRFVTAEPAIATAAAGAVVAYAGAQLVTVGVISDVQAPLVGKLAIPPVAALFVLLLGWLTRKVVSPAAAFAQRVEAEVQRRLGPAGVDELGQLVDQVVPLVSGTAGEQLLERGEQEAHAIADTVPAAADPAERPRPHPVKDETETAPPVNEASSDAVPPDAGSADVDAADDTGDDGSDVDATDDVPSAEDAFTAADVDTAPTPV